MSDDDTATFPAYGDPFVGEFVDEEEEEEEEEDEDEEEEEEEGEGEEEV